MLVAQADVTEQEDEILFEDKEYPSGEIDRINKHRLPVTREPEGTWLNDQQESVFLPTWANNVHQSHE